MVKDFLLARLRFAFVLIGQALMARTTGSSGVFFNFRRSKRLLPQKPQSALVSTHARARQRHYARRI